MSSEKTTGLVLRIVEFSESSCVVTWLTKDFGKITVLAKGARRRKSPFEGAIDLLSTSRIVFLHKKSDSLDLLTEAKLERRFRSASVDLNRLYAGYYLIELLAAMTDEYDPHPELFELATDVLEQMDHGQDPGHQLFRIEIGALNLLGHQPMLNQCVGCGRTKTIETKRVNFGMLAGGIFCDRCRKGKTNVVSLSSETWKLLIGISQQPNHAIEISNSCRGELRKFLNQYISNHLVFKPRLQKYITGI
ncbi:MAG: DNA repair protein RecO [Planctomycetota bacterium]